ncbi:TPA: DUF92 domain-containing protein, partial [Candidatus Micrarchaeota archaeon]|nr:DUF92 domain-containing protein [Candidatus Micrarchaeota archaeon]
TRYGGWEYLALMLFFFLLAIVVTRYEHETKRDMGIYEHERGWENVLSNGFLPTVLAVASPYLGPVPYIACVAAVTADKFGSELGVLDKGKPISLATLKPVKPGVSGAVTMMGTVASLAGATAIGLGAFFIFDMNATAALLIGLAGLGGSFVDSIFGVLEERGLGTKGTTNFICSIAGAILGYIFIK